MRPVRCLVVISAFAAVELWLAGCSDKPRPQPQPEGPPAAATPKPLDAGVVQTAAQTSEAAPLMPLPKVSADPSPQEKYDAALLEALNSLAERKYADALASLLA